MAYFVKRRNRFPDPLELMEREMRSLFNEPLASGQGFYPQLNVHANDQEVLVDVQLPRSEAAKPRKITVHPS